MKILITGGKSSVALKLLKAFTGYEIVLADYGEVPSFSSTAYQLISLGPKNEDVLAHNLLNHCLNEGVDLVLPLHEVELGAVAKAAILFKEFDIDVLLPNDADLSTYQLSEKSPNWVVFNKGEVIFTTQASETRFEQAKIASLSGAYYCIEEPASILSLITI